jgi:hypothetical protein
MRNFMGEQPAVAAIPKNFSLPPWQADRKTLLDPVGVDGAMRPRMIKHGYRPAKIKPVTDD